MRTKCLRDDSRNQLTVIPQVADGVNQPDSLPRTMVPFKHLEANIDLARS